MKSLLSLPLVVAALFSAGCTRSEFHQGFPAIHPVLLLVNDDSPIATGGRVIVTTDYWYPSVFGKAKGKKYIDEFPVLRDGTAHLTLRVHHQITKQELQVIAPGCVPVVTRIDGDLDWAQFQSEPRRFALQKLSGGNSKRTYCRGINAYEPREFRVELPGGKTWFSFASGEFSRVAGDVAFEVQRPSSVDPKKKDMPVKVVITVEGGRLQRMSQYEVIFGLAGQIGKWGDTKAIVLEAKNSRRIPAVAGSFAYTSSDSRTRALVSLSADPVGESPGDAASMRLFLWARIDSYDPRESSPIVSASGPNESLEQTATAVTHPANAGALVQSADL